MPFYRVYRWCAECGIGRPIDIAMAREETNLIGKTLEEFYAGMEVPPHALAVITEQSKTCPKGHTKDVLTLRDFFLDVPE